METYERTVIRFSQRKAVLFCEVCQETGTHFTIPEASSILSITESAIMGLAECGKVHMSAATDGSMLVCGNSIGGRT